VSLLEASLLEASLLEVGRSPTQEIPQNLNYYLTPNQIYY
jgi:hypothetical protein